MHGPSLQAKLFASIEDGDVAQVQGLIASGAELNSASGDLDGHTPLIRAITTGHLGVVRALIQAGADVNLVQRSLRGWTPLMFAFQQPEIMRELLTAGADVNARTPVREVVSPRTGKTSSTGRESAMHIVAAANNLEAAKLLVQFGAETDGRTEDGLGPVDIALRQGSANAVAEFLISAGVELTPSRLQLIHSTALEGDEDVYRFIWADRFQPEPKKPQSEPQIDLPTVGEGNTTDAGFSCPSCGSLLYTRKSLLCGRCGAALPQELLSKMNLVHNQRQEERARARELAEAFGPGAAAKRSALPSGLRQRDNDALPTAAELLRQTSCVNEFKARKRPFFWLYVVGYGFTFLVGALFLAFVGGLSVLGLLVMAGAVTALSLLTWQQASPICPNCNQDIVRCAALHCHVCGKPLKSGRCNTCSVGGGITALLFPNSQPGNSLWITYCPGCGVLLEAKVTRWNSLDSSG